MVKTCPECPARISTPIQLPAPLFAGNAREEDETIPASFPVCCSSVIGAGVVVTVKFTPLLTCPATVTTTLPVLAPVGTGTTMLVALQLVGVAGVPLNVTVLVPWVVPKFAPLIVTAVPTTPEVGLKLVMAIDGVVALAVFEYWL